MIEGQYFDGRSSTPHAAQIDFGADGMVRVHGPAGGREVTLASVRVSDRLARTPRRIRFDDDAVFETLDNDAVDTALAALGPRTFSQRVHHWESRWHVAVGALVAVVAIAVLFVRYGIPLLANVAAHTLPASVDRSIGAQSLQILDHSVMKPSTLPEARQDQLRALFREMTAPLMDGHRYRLELRHGERIGANAFALPDGIVVMTDELVALSKNDEELIAVLAHEIGHVRGRHTLRMLFQSAGVAAITLAVFGDASSVSAIATSVPTMLINARHSREFEEEADAFSRKWLREHGIAESRFDDMLCRLQRESKGGPEIRYLSSHPPTEERAHCSPASSSSVGSRTPANG